MLRHAQHKVVQLFFLLHTLHGLGVMERVIQKNTTCSFNIVDGLSIQTVMRKGSLTTKISLQTLTKVLLCCRRRSHPRCTPVFWRSRSYKTQNENNNNNNQSPYGGYFSCHSTIHKILANEVHCNLSNNFCCQAGNWCILKLKKNSIPCMLLGMLHGT